MVFMKKSLISKFISIIFVFATMLASSHHHDDLQSHIDCQICTIENTLSHADTPIEPVYLSDISLSNTSILGFLTEIIIQKKYHFYNTNTIF